MTLPAFEGRTPTTWPEGTRPTDQELSDWLKACTDWERLDVVTNMRQMADDGRARYLEHHAGLRDELEHTRKHAERQYRAGFGDAVLTIFPPGASS